MALRGFAFGSTSKQRKIASFKNSQAMERRSPTRGAPMSSAASVAARRASSTSPSRKSAGCVSGPPPARTQNATVVWLLLSLLLFRLLSRRMCRLPPSPCTHAPACDTTVPAACLCLLPHTPHAAPWRTWAGRAALHSRGTDRFAFASLPSCRCSLVPHPAPCPLSPPFPWLPRNPPAPVNRTSPKRGRSPSSSTTSLFSASGSLGSIPTRQGEEDPRRVVILKSPTTGYGFMLVGNAPVYIQSLDDGGPAEVCLGPGPAKIHIFVVVCAGLVGCLEGLPAAGGRTFDF